MHVLADALQKREILRPRQRIRCSKTRNLDTIHGGSEKKVVPMHDASPGA